MKINIEKIIAELDRGTFTEAIDAFLEIGAHIRAKIDEQKKAINDSEIKISRIVEGENKYDQK